MLSDGLTYVCLTSIAYIRLAGGVCGWLDGAYWLTGPGLAQLAWFKGAIARFHCRPGRGHIVAAARLQHVNYQQIYNTVNVSDVLLLTLLSLLTPLTNLHVILCNSSLTCFSVIQLSLCAVNFIVTFQAIANIMQIY